MLQGKVILNPQGYPDGKKVKFWIINDVSHYTALLPSEY